MTFPDNFEQKIGFDKVRELLQNRCLSNLGKNFVNAMRFTTQVDSIEKYTGQVAEFKNICQYESSFPSSNYLDVTDYLNRAEIIGIFLDEEAFLKIVNSLKTIQNCLIFFKKKEDSLYPLLKQLAADISVEESLIKQIEKVIDEQGKVKDSASKELQRIRKELNEQYSNLRRQAQRLLKHAKSQGWASDDATITVRDGRVVLPFLAESKRRVKGLTYDESANGNIVFLEPEELFETNNEIRSLENQEKREIVKILTELTAELRIYLIPLRKAYHFLGLIDFIRAKALLAVEMEAIKPFIVSKPYIKWQTAYHPLLFLSYKRAGKQVVPFDITLEPEHRILVISGPNAGGKSVTLKTMALQQYMFQCGLLVPCNENSTFGVFQHIFLDIGDQQSIENDLSTYSSHLSAMNHFMKYANKLTLFLIDEFGSGTEPQAGGAIAEAILHQLNKSKAFGVITTHYLNLKAYAENSAEVENAAMLFDPVNMLPLYQLQIGKPGSSYAFEIAQRMGLNTEVLNNARKNAGKKQVNFEELINKLDAEKIDFQSKIKDIDAKEKRLKRLMAEYEELKKFAEDNKNKILRDAKIQAQNIVNEANKKVEYTIKKIKEGQADKELAKQARKVLDDFKKEITKEFPKELPKPKFKKAEIQTIKVGDTVKINDTDTLAEVLKINEKEAEVLIGELRSNIKTNRLTKVDILPKKKKPETSGTSKSINLAEKRTNFEPNLDIRGKRAEEVLPILENFIDNAILLSVGQLTILHGKGEGILRQIVRQKLREYKEIKSVADEHPDRGGAGITVVTL
jgi:DNA mismatch repair protein MutS2